jgi:hypothetical protein
LRKAGLLGGELQWQRDTRPFQNALKRLWSAPELAQKYFGSEPRAGVIIDPEPGSKKADLTVANPEFHEWDPARFIVGAKAGVLMPYGEPNRKAALAYLEAQKRPKREEEEYKSNPLALVTDFAKDDGEANGTAEAT